MTPDELIAETLRLDGEATKKANAAAYIKRFTHNDYAAPRLARMLKVAVDDLMFRSDTRAVELLAEIERIAKEEA